MSDLSWLNSHTPCNRCVRFATTVASGHATLATKRTLLLTWAGLPPAGSHQLCLAHSFDHLVGEREQLVGDYEAERLRRSQVYDHLELSRQQHRQVGRLVTPEDATCIAANESIHLGQVRPIADEAAGAGEFPPRIHCRHRVAGGERDNPLPAG